MNKSAKVIVDADAIIAQADPKDMAEEYRADAIFSFDKFYKTKGFRLAIEL